MLNAQDIADRFRIEIRDVAAWHAKRILPEPIRIGGECRWREEDIDLFENYLRDRRDWRERGLDPDDPNGPAVPVYSTGDPRFDPREAVAQERERMRQERSRTLRAGSTPIEKQAPVEMPDATEGSKECRQ